MPEIAGIDRFDGDIFHTARWDHSVQLEGRRVGVVGNGSTGVQIVSALAGIASNAVPLSADGAMDNAGGERLFFRRAARRI